MSDYLQAVYAEVEDHADEYGRIQNKTVRCQGPALPVPLCSLAVTDCS